MKTKISARALALTLALVMLASAFIALPVSAVDIEEEPLPDFLWELDFNKMTSITDNMGSTEYSIEGKNVKLVEAHGKKALGIVQGNGNYIINDLAPILNEYDTFSIEADMFFESYPAGEAGGKTSHEYPMSFVTWITGGETGALNYRSIRMDDEGYLCTGTTPVEKPEQKSDAKLPLGEWFNIRFLVSPLTGFCEVYINGQNLLSYKIGSPTTLATSQVRFFDTRYTYTAYFSNISVYSNSSYRIGLIEEDAADYVAYQTTKVENGKFDLRVISGTNIENVADYNRSGFLVTTLSTENGEVVANEQDINITTVYESLIAAGEKVTAAELGSKYIVPIPVEGLDANALHTEIIVRPYIKKDGMRYFGDAAILTYSGETKDGYPVLDIAGNSVEYTAFPSDDTFVKLDNDENFGTMNYFELKNNGQHNAYTREIYIKFSFSENALKRLLSSSRVYLEFYVNSHRALTEEEKAEGGILADICGVDTGWTETELTGKNAPTLAKEIEYIGDVRYNAKQYTQVDVTEYILNNAKNGQVAFKISNVENDGASGQMNVASSEASTGAPRLVIYPIMYNHEINLGKLKNVGYEPWGYAEQIVNEWFKIDYDALYGHEPYETLGLKDVDNTSPTGDYTVRVDWKSNSPGQKWNTKVYARSLDSLTGFNPGAISEYDEYGGITNSGIKGEATGYFHTEKHGERTYIIDPIGNPFFATGINTAELGATANQQEAALAKYGSVENFCKEVADELRAIGINTYWGGEAGLFEQNKLARAIGLGCMSGYMGGGSLALSISTGGSAKYLHNNTMNVFDPDFITYCEGRVASILTEQYKDNPFILGIYSDNEIPSQPDMLYCYLTIDPTEPVNAFSYATAWTWLMKYTGNPNPSVTDVTDEMSEEFKTFVYNRYFKCVTEAIDNGGFGQYMYLGNRIHSDNKDSEGYLRAASKYVDVLTVNLYGGLTPSVETIQYMYQYTGKPFIVTEFFTKADDAVDMNGYGFGNQTNAGSIVKTQADRAAYYENYTLVLLESQTCVGWTWYRFRDNDQTIYIDDAGNLYRAYDYQDGEISAYTNVNTGFVVEDGPAFAPSLTVYYRGESDTSNLGSNKGIYDNKMNMYEELTSSMKLVTDNIFSIIDYFDSIHK